MEPKRRTRMRLEGDIVAKVEVEPGFELELDSEC